MSDKPKVSIITIAYKHEKYIGEALDSFLAQQTDFKFEIIVADDCSPDDTAKIINQYAKKHPDIIKPILRNKNIGALGNFYDALRHAKGEYIALCEGDDYWTHPRKLQKESDFLDKNKDYTICFHPVKVVFVNDDTKSYIYPAADYAGKFDTEALLRQNFIQTNSVMYRRQDYSNLPERILPADWYMHLLHAKFGKIGFINEVMSVYRRHPGGIWWDSHNDVDKIWQRYGIEHLGLYMAIKKLYGEDETYRKIVDEHVVDALDKLVTYSRKHKTNILNEALAEYPEGAVTYINNLQEQIAGLDKHAIEQSDIIRHYIDKSEHFENENKQLRTQLDSIRNSGTYKVARAVYKTLPKRRK